MTKNNYQYVVRASSNAEAQELAQQHNLEAGSWLRLPFTIEDKENAVFQFMDEEELANVTPEEIEDFFKIFVMLVPSMGEAQSIADHYGLPKQSWSALISLNINRSSVYRMLPAYSDAVVA